MRKLGIRYPVALDNDFVTWTNYANQYWPAKYLIDRSGRVRYYHYGEVSTRRPKGRSAASSGTASAGRSRRWPTGRRVARSSGVVSRLRPARELRRQPGRREPRGGVPLPALPRPWPTRVRGPAGRRAGADRGQARCRLRIQFSAREVNLVLGGNGRLEVLLDGRRRRGLKIGGEPRLYRLLELPELREGLLELRFTPGLSGYAFTFG